MTRVICRFMATSLQRATSHTKRRSHALLLRGALLAVATLIVPSSAVVLLLAPSGSVLSPQKVSAQTPNTTLNFQARILTSAGALVADGNYNLEFKIYDTSSTGGTAQGVCTGNCLWMETRTGANVVRVVNGYVSVNLGSVTAFGSTIPWSKDLYVTMRVGGIGTPSWDTTEMTNATTGRMKFSSVPLAFIANNVKTSDRASGTATDNIAVQTGNATAAASGNITIQTGTTTTSGNSGNITIDVGSAATTAGTISIAGTSASALGIGRSGIITTVTGGLTQLTGAVSLTGNAASSLTTSSGALTLTSAAAATWSTAAGALTLQGFAGTTLTTPGGTTTSASTHTTGNASAGSSGASNINTGTGTTGTGVIALLTGNASAGTAGNITLDVGTSTTSNGSILLGTSARAQTITLGNSTGATGITLNTGTAGVSIASNGVANTVQIGNTSGAVAQTLNIGNNATVSSATTITLGSSVGTSSTTINAGTSGTVSIGASGVTSNVMIGNPAGAASSVTLGSNVTTSATTINAGSSGILMGTGGVANTIQIGNTSGAVAQTISIGNNATASSTNTVNIGSTIAGVVTLQSATQINLNAPTLNRTASGSTTLNLNDAANTTLALANSGTGVANLTVDGAITAATGLTVTAGGASITGNTSIATTAGNTLTVGNGTGTFQLTSTALNVSTAGALTGVTGITTSGGYTQSGASANTLTGATTLSGGLISTNAGNVAFQKAADISTTGNNNNVALTGALVRFTGASAQTLTGIAGGTDGRIITIINAAATSLTINNNDTVNSTSGNAIITGTGAAISLPAGSSAYLVYDSTAPGQWRVNSIGAAQSGAFIANGTAAQNTANFNIQSAAVGSVTGKLRALASQTADILQVRDSADTNTLLNVTSFGNVGVGVAAPTSLFQVSQGTAGYGTVTTNATVNLVGVGTQFTNTFKVGDTITVSGETVRTIATITDDTHLASTVAFTTATAGHTYTLVGGDRLIVDGNGNVGIGASTPTARLHVVGAVSTSFTPANWTQNAIFDTAATSTQDIIEMRVAGTRRGSLRIDSSGNTVLNGSGTGAVFLGYDEGSGGVNFGNGAGAQVGFVSSTGDASFNGTLTVNGGSVYSYTTGIMPNGDFEQWNSTNTTPMGYSNFWSLGTPTVARSATHYGSVGSYSAAATFTAASNGYQRYQQLDEMEVTPGEYIDISFYAQYTGTAGATVPSIGATLVSNDQLNGAQYFATGGVATTIASCNLVAASTWQLCRGTVQVPANDYRARIDVSISQGNAAGVIVGYIDKIQATRRSVANVDGNIGVGVTPVTGRILTVNGISSITAGNRLQLVSSGNTNLWNFDNISGSLRIFREDYSATGTGANGSVKFSIADNGTVSTWGPVNTTGAPGLKTLSLDSLATSTQTVVELKVAGTQRATYRADSLGNIVVSGSGTGATYLGYDDGTGGIKFGSGASGVVGSVSSAGAASFNSTGSFGGLVNMTNYLQINSKYVVDGTDTWLRLNQQGSFTSGTYTPGLIRADGGFYVGSGGAQIQGNATQNIVYSPSTAVAMISDNTGVYVTVSGAVGNTHLCEGGFGRIELCTSSRALKHNITDSSYGLTQLRQLRPVQYAWNTDGRLDAGFIAEEASAIVPETTQWNADGTVKSFNFDPIVSVNTAAIKQLDIQIQSMDARLAVVEAGNFAHNIHVAGYADITGNLTVHGDTTLAKLTVTGDTSVQKLTVNGKIITAGAAPTVVLGTQATGDGAVITLTGNDVAGTITYDAGAENLPANPLATGEQVQVNFVSPYDTQPRVNITPTSEDAAVARYYVKRTTTGFTLVFIDAPQSGKSYSYDYQILQ